jgi:hypothetical protein
MKIRTKPFPVEFQRAFHISLIIILKLIYNTNETSEHKFRCTFLFQSEM